jgi:hypothetical protein
MPLSSTAKGQYSIVFKSNCLSNIASILNWNNNCHAYW